MPEVVEITADALTVAVAAAAREAAVSAGSHARIGVDVVDIRRLERQIAVVGERFVAKLLTSAEMAHCAGRVEQLATRIAAKEAAAKVLGTGFRGVGWREIEVVTAPNGAPSFHLSGAAATAARALGFAALKLSCSHEGGFAVAVVASVSRAVAPVTPEESMGGDGLERDQLR
jgi:holo-[acyl-carrier protein] synthase